MSDVFYVRDRDEVGYVGEGVVVTIPLSSLRGAFKSLRGYIGDDAESVEGFFDFVKKAVKSVGQTVASITKNPLVRAVVGVIPYGSTALTVIDVADKAFAKGTQAIAKKPATHQLIRDAAKGVPAAKAALRKLPPAAKKKAAVATKVQASTFALKEDMANLRKGLAASGYTPGMIQALKTPRAPWTR